MALGRSLPFIAPTLGSTLFDLEELGVAWQGPERLHSIKSSSRAHRTRVGDAKSLARNVKGKDTIKDKKKSPEDCNKV